ncbi:YopX family protein [Bacillus cereus]
MSRYKFRTWDKKAKVMEQYQHLQLSPNGQLYHDGMNVTDNYEIMQSIDMTDKHGTEIYEGDILKGPGLYETPENHTTTYLHWKVEYRNGTFYLGYDPIEDDMDWICAECEVVGNVYENAELLEF